MTLRSALTADWPLKLTSIALSVLLWLVASSEEAASGLLRVELRVQPPPGRSVVRDPAPLRATVVGPRRDLLRLSRDNLVLTRILPDTLTSDSALVAIDPADLVFAGNGAVHVQDVQPREVVVQLDPEAQRAVPVRPRVRIPPLSGLELVGAVAVSPATVRVAGPADRIATIDSVLTAPIALTRTDGPTEERVAVDTTGYGPVRVFPPLVTVTMTVQAMGERTIWPVPVQIPSALGFRPDRDTVTVRVRGPRARLAGLTPDSVVVTVDRPDAGTSRAALRVLLPAGLSGKAAPDSVTLRRRSDRG